MAKKKKTEREFVTEDGIKYVVFTDPKGKKSKRKVAVNDKGQQCYVWKNKNGTEVLRPLDISKGKKASIAELIARYTETYNKHMALAKEAKRKIEALKKRQKADEYEKARNSVDNMTTEQLGAFEVWKKEQGIA